MASAATLGAPGACRLPGRRAHGLLLPLRLLPLRVTAAVRPNALFCCLRRGSLKGLLEQRLAGLHAACGGAATHLWQDLPSVTLHVEAVAYIQPSVRACCSRIYKGGLCWDAVCLSGS